MIKRIFQNLIKPIETKKSASVKTKGKKEILIMGNLFWNVFNTASDAILLLQDYKIVDCNKKALELYGVEHDELIGKYPYDFSPDMQPDGQNSVEKGKIILDKIFSEGTLKFEWLQKKNNGDNFLAEIVATSFKSDNNYYVAATIRDITILRREQHELLQYRMHLEELVKRQTTELTTSNEAFQKANDNLDITNKELSSAYEKLNTANEELITNNKELLRINQQIREEIDLHKKTREEKLIVEEKLKQFIFQSGNAIIISNSEGIIEEWNNAMIQFTGIESEEAKGKYIWDIVYKISPDKQTADSNRESFKQNTIKFFSDIKQGKLRQPTFESQIRHKDSSLRNIHSLLYPIITSSGHYSGIIIMDITQKKKTEAELERYRKELEVLLAKNTERLNQISSRFNEVYNNTSDVITFIDVLDEGRKLKVFDMNPVALKLVHITPEKIQEGVYASDIISKDVYDTFVKDSLPSILSGNSITIKTQSTNQPVFWKSNIIPIKEENGKVCRIGVFSQNITSEEEHERVSTILDLAIESWPFELWVSDKSGKCIMQNASSHRIWGNLTGTYLKDMNIPDSLKKSALVNLEKVLRGEPTSTEYELETPNGKRYVMFNLTPIIGKDKIANGFLGIGIDITERKQAELKVVASEENYRLLAENIDDVIWKYDIKSKRFTYVSPSIFKMRGFTAEEAIIQPISQWLMPDSLKGVETELPVMIKLFQDGNMNVRTRKYELQVELIRTFLTGPDGLVNEVIASCRNISDRKLAEEALRKNEERYRLITKLSGYVVYDFNIENKTTVWTGAIEEVTGYTTEEIQLINPFNLKDKIHPDDFELLRLTFTNPESYPPWYNIKFRFLNKIKGYIWIEADGFKFNEDNNKTHRWLGIMKDITEQKRTQDLIHESEKKLRTIFDTSKDGIILLDKDLRIIDLNSSIFSKSDFTYNEIIGKRAFEFIAPDKLTTTSQWLNSIWDAKIVRNFETEIKTNTDTFLPVEISANPLVIKEEKALLLMIRDISERKNLEKELLTSVINTEERERVHFSQELHDGLGPLISAAKMYIEWMEKPDANINKNDIIPDVKKLLEEAANSLRDISFKLSPHILQNFGIIEAVNAYLEKIKESSKIIYHVNSSDLPRLDDKTETIIYRVLCECINNTIKHAMAKTISINFQFEKNNLTIIYSDDGKGFDVEKILAGKKGIGLLNMMSRIKSINGTIKIQSSTKAGTKTTIKIHALPK